MKNEMFVPVTRITSSPDVKNDGKARVDTGKPTLTQQGIDVDAFIRENHTLIERLRKGTRKNTKNATTGKKKETMTTTSKPAANKEEPMSQGITANKETVLEKECENPRTIISNALTGVFDSISALQRTAFQTNDKVVYGFATKLLNGELMDLKANYSKDTAK